MVVLTVAVTLCAVAGLNDDSRSTWRYGAAPTSRQYLDGLRWLLGEAADRSGRVSKWGSRC